MSEEELIETLKEFEKNRVDELKEPSRNLFYAIMKIADERDKYKEVIDKIKYNIEINVISMKNGKLLIELDVNKLNELLEEIK